MRLGRLWHALRLPYRPEEHLVFNFRRRRPTPRKLGPKANESELFHRSDSDTFSATDGYPLPGQGDRAMGTVTRGQKIYFAAVGLLALWVGIWGYFIPTQVDKAIPWLVPPLHARFLGAMYLSGAAFMIGGILSHYYGEVRIMVRVIPIWTGMLFIVSLFYLNEFDYSRTQVWIWFGAYLIYPLIALWLIWRDRTVRESIAGPGLPAWVRGYLLAQGIVVTALALALLLLPAMMVNVWPWKITRLLAQIYS